jgi:hypothetical protein
MRSLYLAGIFAAAVALAPNEARAGTLRIAAGANYWFEERAYFDGTLGYEWSLIPILSVGFRGGVLLVTGPSRAGFETDLIVRLSPAPSFYIEGLGGPWFMLNSGGETIRAHAAVGAGLQIGPISFGPEVGYLQPNAIIGGRLTFRI